MSMPVWTMPPYGIHGRYGSHGKKRRWWRWMGLFVIDSPSMSMPIFSLYINDDDDGDDMKEDADDEWWIWWGWWQWWWIWWYGQWQSGDIKSHLWATCTLNITGYNIYNLYNIYNYITVILWFMWFWWFCFFTIQQKSWNIWNQPINWEKFVFAHICVLTGPWCAMHAKGSLMDLMGSRTDRTVYGKYWNIESIDMFGMFATSLQCFFFCQCYWICGFHLFHLHFKSGEVRMDDQSSFPQMKMHRWP